MDHASSSIEQIIFQALAELGFANPVFRGQTFLMHNRELVGRRLCFDGVSAVWLSSERRIKLYGEVGDLLRVIDIGDEPVRAAA